MTGLILNLLLSIRENYTIQGKKNLGLSLVTLPFSRALYPPPPPPPIKHASFSDLPWVPGNFLAQFPDFRPPSLTSSPPYSLEIPRIWRSHAPFSAAWAWGSTSLRYISYPVSRRKISLRRPKEHLTRSRDFCTINSFICCSFLCRDQHVSHTEPFGSVLFLVLLSFTCSW